MTCERCGKDLQIGEWPFCGGIHQHGFPSMSVQADEIPGGFVQEHFGPTPGVFYSKSAMARRAKELGVTKVVSRNEFSARTKDLVDELIHPQPASQS